MALFIIITLVLFLVIIYLALVVAFLSLKETFRSSDWMKIDFREDPDVTPTNRELLEMENDEFNYGHNIKERED